MLGTAQTTDADFDVLALLRLKNEILFLLTALPHATVKIVPVVAELLNFTVKESPLFKVSADP